MYNPKSLKAEEFIDDGEIRETLKYAHENRHNRELIDSILEKAKECKGLSHREAAVLLECDLPDEIEKMFELAREIKQKFYGNRIVMFAPLYLSNYCINGCVYCPYHQKNKTIPRRKLTQDEIRREVIALQDMGHKRLAIEAGEDPVNNPIEYILESIKTIYSIHHENGDIRRVNVNIAATTVENYRKLKEAGIGTYILFQETPASDKLSGLVAGSFDITDPSFSKKVAADIAGYNSNKEITGNVITTDLVDNLGYGYMGICATTVNVGGEPASEASKDLRKGFATLLAVYRDTAINSYYGEAASVIQYPISNTSWAAPRPADEGYQIAFSVDVDGNPIYTDGMTEEEKYAAALDAAIGYFKAAGYTWDEAAGKFTAAPAGAKLDYTAMIPADGTGDHPAFGIYTATKEALASIGINFQINDLSDSNVLWNALESGECEMWTAAWSATVDPDMYQIYHSDNIVGKGGTDSNHYAVADAQLDELILEARTSPDQAFRKATYKQCLDILMDWAVEVPNYQRQNCIIFSTERVNMDTVTPDITTFWGWMNDLELLEVNAK